LEEQVDIHLARKVSGIPNGIEKATFEKTNVGSTSEEGNDHDGVDGVQAGTTGDGL